MDSVPVARVQKRALVCALMLVYVCCCCGGGGGLRAVNYNLTTDITQRKIDEAIELGARTIVSACPNCKAQFSDAIEIKKEKMKDSNEKFKMKVMDILDVVAKCI